ncbi:C40 family peptidase [Rhodoplanes roseus]|uniref:Peptidase P60 n=1 Tax=Rhodoplanes roseus TaxID=29409 RepID=A0A327L0D4_9BRAD|nr:NlpC/P60 family protein [Rhodoplanes roseus]RAI43724.1 peptidase P60 [Rhodoplanes roseus]
MNRRDLLTLLPAAALSPLAARAQGAGLDPRITPARSDLAAKSLEGQVAARRFVEGRAQEVIAAQAPVRKAPSPTAELLTEALKGERVTVYDLGEDGFAWGQLEADGYVGYLPAAALGASGPAPTHRVVALRTVVLPGPSVKLPPVETLPFGARLAIARIDGPYAVTASGGHVPLVHLAPVGAAEDDMVAVAERFLGTPYLWGGKTSLGLDCSALTQLALSACGIACPRDTDMQETALGTPLADPQNSSAFRRGDLVFWKGHVAIVRDAATLLHANAHHMAAAIEPTAPALARIATTAGPVTSVRRLGP